MDRDITFERDGDTGLMEEDNTHSGIGHSGNGRNDGAREACGSTVPESHGCEVELDKPQPGDSRSLR